MRSMLVIAMIFSLAGVAASADSTDLVDAAEARDWSRVAELLDSGADASQTQADGMTALHWAAHWNHADSTRRLIEKGCDVSAENDYGIVPLVLACRVGNREVAELLLDAEAGANTKVAGDESVLMMAARAGNPELAAALLDHGADIDAKNRHGQTALMWAAAAGNHDTCDLLLKRNADWEEELRSGFNAMMFAARQGHIDVVKRFLDEGADVNDRMNPVNSSGRAPRKGMSALMLAVESGHYELALKLVQWGADPNDQRSGFAPLHALSWARRPSRGDNPEGDPPPVITGGVGSLQFARELVAAGADVNLQLNKGSYRKARVNYKGATPLFLASFTGDVEYARVLVELGADPLLPNDDGTTPLLAAAGVGIFVADEFPGTEEETLVMVEQLMAWGAKINDIDKRGETVVHGAAYRSFPKVVDQLVGFGADPELWYRKNEMGSTPRELAQGKRPGSFKPNKATIAAIDRALQSAGIKPTEWKRPLDQKAWEDQ